MAFDLKLNVGTTINNNELCDIFKCSPQGGMRRATKTNSLVIISNHVESIYEDRWINGVLHYTGMGRKGDQSLDFMQNKTFAESKTNGIKIFLFEIFKYREYRFAGEVLLADKPYQEQQLDEEGNIRTVWIFPIKPVNGEIQVERQDYDELFRIKEEAARKLPFEELRRRAKYAQKKVSTRQATITQYDRSPWVSMYAKRRANGKCDLCGQAGPFLGKDSHPYLENHHIEWLAKGGADTIENTVALCPNCHRRMHILNSVHDKTKLINLNKSREMGNR